MGLSELKKQIYFIHEVEKLKTVSRANKTLDGRCENSAEHSWHVALVAQVFEKYAPVGIDMYKVTKLLLIHDIVEIDVGDTWLYAEDQSHKRASEEKAATRIFSILPGEQGDEFRALWDEFENRLSREAKFAAAIDGINPLINHLLTGSPDDGVIPVEKVLAKKSFIKSCAPALWPLVESLIEESVEAGLYV